MSGCGFARRGSMGTAPLPLDSIDKEQQEWGAQASAPSRHVAAKHPFWRLGQNIQLKTMLLVSSLAAAFVLLRCYHQLTAVNISGKGSLRSLAEGEGAGRATPCWETGLRGYQSPAGASGAIDSAMLERTENVVQRLIQVTKDCSSVAVMLPSPFLMKLGDLFLGLCIQEVAALSTLLEDQFDRQKADVLQTAMDAAHELMRVSQQRDNNAQLLHASRLLKFARRLLNPEVKDSPLAKSVRLRMLTELLALQEAALGLIETAVSSALKSLHSKRHATAELINELFEELRRVIYTRRRHVFKSKHLSRHLRRYERGYNRAVMMGIRDIQRLDEEPDTTFEAKLAELRDTKAWIKMPLEKTRRLLLEAAHQKEGHPAKQQELQVMQSAAVEVAQASGTRSGRGRRRFEVPPRFQGKDRFYGPDMRRDRTQGSIEQAEANYPKQGQDIARGFRPSDEAQSSLAAQALEHQTPSIASPPRQPLPELEKALSKLSLGSQLTRGARSSSGPVGSSSLTAQPQPTVPATEGTLGTSRGRREAPMRLDMTDNVSWSPWSSAWVPRSPATPLLPISGSTSTTATQVTGSLEGLSLYQSTQAVSRQRRSFIAAGTPPPSFRFFTTPQLIAEAANEMLESIRSEAQRTDMQGMAVPHSWSSVGGASLFTPSSLTRGRTNQASGIYNWSGTDGRRGAVSLGGQGIAHREEMMQGPLGPLSAVPSLQELLEQAQIEEALGGSPWFGIDSDRG